MSPDHDEVFATMRPAYLFASVEDEQYHEAIASLHQQWRMLPAPRWCFVSGDGRVAVDLAVTIAGGGQTISDLACGAC